MSDVRLGLPENIMKQNQQTVAGTILSVDEVVSAFQYSNRARSAFVH